MTVDEKIDCFFDTILREPKDQCGHFNAILGAECLGEIGNYEPRDEDKILKSLSLPELIAKDVVKSVIADLKSQKSKLFLFLSPLLYDSASSVRKATVDAFGKTEDPQLLPFLFPLLDDPCPFVFMSAVHALWGAGDTQVISLLETIIDERSDAVRKAAKGTPGEIRSSQVIPFFISFHNDVDICQAKKTGDPIYYFQPGYLIAFFDEYSTRYRLPFYQRNNNWYCFDNRNDLHKEIYICKEDDRR